MDIDDILAEVDKDRVPQEIQDLQELTRAWMNERSAPTVFPYPEQLMSRTLERVKNQVARIEDLLSSPAPSSSSTLPLIILQTDLERHKFLIRSYLRARLAKLSAYALYYMITPTARSLLSPSELQFLSAYEQLRQHHYHASFLSQFPASLRSMDDRKGGTNMVEGPDEDAAVVVRGLKDAGEVRVAGTDIRFEMRRGGTWIVRWSAVKGMVEDGEAELV